MKRLGLQWWVEKQGMRRMLLTIPLMMMIAANLSAQSDEITWANEATTWTNEARAKLTWKRVEFTWNNLPYIFVAENENWVEMDINARRVSLDAKAWELHFGWEAIVCPWGNGSWWLPTSPEYILWLGVKVWHTDSVVKVGVVSEREWRFFYLWFSKDELLELFFGVRRYHKSRCEL